MLLIPVAWIIIFFILLSLGGGTITLLSAITNKKDTTFGIFQYAWLGYTVLIAILQWFSIFSPVNHYAFLLIVCLAAAGMCSSWRTVSNSVAFSVRSLSTKVRCICLLSIILLASLIAYHASLPLQLYDTELYHLNAVKWASSYPAIPGIVNLHGRLAFNSSFHLFAALLNNGFWHDRTVYVANSFILFLTCFQWAMCLLTSLHPETPDEKLTKSSDKIRLSYCFALLTSPYLILSILRMNVSSLSTDLVTQLLILVVIYYILYGVYIDGEDLKASYNSQADRLFMGMLIVAMSSVIVSTKLSGAIVFAVIVTVLPLQTWFIGKENASGRSYGREMILTFSLALIVLAGMVARYIILSGWIVYPFPIGNLHLDWSALPAQVASELDWIRSWARMPGKLPEDILRHGFLHWYIQWYDLFFARNWIAKILINSGVVGLFYLLLAGSAKRYRTYNSPLLFSITIALGGLSYWFATAPDYRFGEVYFWSLAGTSLTPVIADAMQGNVSRNFLAVSVIIAFLSLQKFQGGFPELFPAAVSLWDLPVSKSRKVVPVKINNGQSPPLIIFRPLHGDRCGNSPVPCAPGVTPESTIELRRPGEIRSGFRLKRHEEI